MFRKNENIDYCAKEQTSSSLNPLNPNLSHFRVEPTIIRMNLLISQYRFINLVWKLLTRGGFLPKGVGFSRGIPLIALKT